MDSTNLTFLNARAQFLFEIGNLNAAEIEFIRIIEVQPNFISLNFMSFLKATQYDYESSKTFAEKSLTYASNSDEKSEAYFAIGQAESKRFQYESAYTAYLKSIEFNPKNVSALNNITTVLDKVNRSDEKLYYFEKIVSIDPSFYQIHINIGFYYLKQEKYQKAVDEFNIVLKNDPFQPFALSNKAFALLKLGSLEDALNTINLSLQYDSKNAFAYKNKGLILIELGEIQSACQELKTAIQLNFTQQYGNEAIDLIKIHCD